MGCCRWRVFNDLDDTDSRDNVVIHGCVFPPASANPTTQRSTDDSACHSQLCGVDAQSWIFLLCSSERFAHRLWLSTSVQNCLLLLWKSIWTQTSRDFNLSLQTCQTTIDVGSILHGIWARITTSIESFIGTSYQPAVITEYILCKQVKRMIWRQNQDIESLPLISKKMDRQHFLSHHHNQLMDGVLADGAHKVVLSDVRLYIHLRAREQHSNCITWVIPHFFMFPSMSVLKRVHTKTVFVQFKQPWKSFFGTTTFILKQLSVISANSL